MLNPPLNCINMYCLSFSTTFPCCLCTCSNLFDGFGYLLIHTMLKIELIGMWFRCQSTRLHSGVALGLIKYRGKGHSYRPSLTTDEIFRTKGKGGVVGAQQKVSWKYDISGRVEGKWRREWRRRRQILLVGCGNALWSDDNLDHSTSVSPRLSRCKHHTKVQAESESNMLCCFFLILFWSSLVESEQQHHRN